MDISTALGYSLLGMVIVFVMLIMLMASIKIMGAAFGTSKKAPAQAVAPQPSAIIPAQKAHGTAGACDLHSVDDRTAAMLMAIVADKMGAPLNTLRFISIKEIGEV